MLLRISGRVFQKSWAALLQQRGHWIRNESLGLDDQTEPIGKCSPLNELRNGLGQAVRRNKFAFVICNPL